MKELKKFLHVKTTLRMQFSIGISQIIFRPRYSAFRDLFQDSSGKISWKVHQNVWKCKNVYLLNVRKHAKLTLHILWNVVVSRMSCSTWAWVSPTSVIPSIVFKCWSRLVCNSRKSCSNCLRARQCLSRELWCDQNKSNVRSVSSNCTSSLRRKKFVVKDLPL